MLSVLGPTDPSIHGDERAADERLLISGSLPQGRHFEPLQIHKIQHPVA